MKLFFHKYVLPNQSPCLAPDDQNALEWLNHLSSSDVISVEAKKLRNYKFHRKMFALFQFLFSQWEPEIEDGQHAMLTEDGDLIIPEKSFERFRKDLTILAGHYECHYLIDGSVRIEAKSLSYDKMSTEAFEELYSNVINVGLKHILPNYSRSDLDEVLSKLLAFV